MIMVKTRAVLILASLILSVSCANSAVTNLPLASPVQPISPPPTPSGTAAVQNPLAAPTKYVSVQVEPPSDSGLLKQRIDKLALGSSSPELIQLLPTIHFHSKYTSKPGSNVTISDISAISPDIIAIPDPTTSLTNDVIAPISQDQSGFTFAFIADQRYRVAVNQLGKNGKPPVFFWAQNNADFEQNVPLSYSGTMVSGQITSSGDAIHVEDYSTQVQVSILQGSRLVSAVASPDGTGAFSIQLASPLYDADPSKSLILQIEPLSNFSYLPVILQPLTINLQKPTADLGVISLGSIAGLHHIKFSVLAPDQTPLPNIHVNLQGSVGKGTSQLQMDTDANGVADFVLANGTYSISAIPPGGSPYKVMTNTQFIVDQSISTKTITLAPRDVITGTLASKNLQPVNGARLQFNRLGPQNSTELQPIVGNSTLLIEAQTDASGNFCSSAGLNPVSACAPVQLDEGFYMLNVTPPAGSQLPFYSTTFNFPADHALTVVLPDPVTISGQVVDSTNQMPVKKAFVHIVQAATILGQTITDDQGNFTAFVSPQ